MGALYKLNFQTKRLEEIEPDSAHYPTVAPPYAIPDPATVQALQDKEAARLERLERLRAIAPAGSSAVIVAELRKDQSDPMTDYFGSSRVRTVAIGFRKSKRESFPEMRKAAARFEPTAEYGPGREIFHVRVVLDTVLPRFNGGCM